MKTLNKPIAKYAAIAVVSASLVGVAFADMAKPVPLQPQGPQQQMSQKMLKLQKTNKAFHKRNFHKQKFKRSFTGSWATALHRTKQLTPAEANTVANAAVILYGDSSMKVGKITPVQAKRGHENYKVQITNQDGKVLNTFTMNGINGKLMPAKADKTAMLKLQPAQ